MEYQERDFNAALNDAQNPDLLSYEYFVESHGLKIYRSYKQESKLYEYKVVGVMEINARLFSSVYMDINYRKKWDTYAKELKYVQESAPEIIYWEVAYPWPLANRDYVYVREMKNLTKDGNDNWIILARSVKLDEVKKSLEVDEKNGVVRVTDYQQTMVISDNGENSSKIFMHYYDDPKGNIPSMIINWAAKTGVPGFLTNMKDACENYVKGVSK